LIFIAAQWVLLLHDVLLIYAWAELIVRVGKSAFIAEFAIA
jgi:hypothetical protein